MCHRLHAHFVNDDISNVELDRFVEYTNDVSIHFSCFSFYCCL